ncbi:MAG: DUF349 domain-containing protein [Victivallales bacterium]|nr:DUF349 domain-containing protein [Victivallales bacterium]
MENKGHMESYTFFKMSNEPVEKNLNETGDNESVISAGPNTKQNDCTAEKPGKGHLVEKKIKELVNTVEEKSISTNWAPTKSEFEKIKEKLEELDPEKIHRELHNKFEEYYNIFERRYNNHLIVKKTINHKEDLCEEIEKLIETAQDNSATEKFNEIQEKWNSSEDLHLPEQFDEVLQKKYKKLCKNFQEKMENIKEVMGKNEQIYKQMKKCCEEAENILDEESLIKSKERLKNLKNKWESIKENSGDFKELKERFEKTEKNINDKLEKYTLELDNKKVMAQDTARNIISQIEDFSNSTKIKNVLQKVKDLQKEWDNLNTDLLKKEQIKKFNKLIKKYFSKLKFIQQKEDWERWENYTNKLLLCERIEQLSKESDTFKVAKGLKTIWDEWRAIGQVPREKNEEIWQRFNSVRQQLKSRCNEFFRDLKVERKKNTELKQELCKKAEELSESTDWESTAEELKKIQQEWKEIGPAAKDIDDELYSKFRNACNIFFENRIAFYKKLHERQALNKNEKKELIEEAEKLRNLFWKDAVKKIKKLRMQWKKIGSASRQDEQKLWNRFNSSIENYLAELDAGKAENLEKKDEVCKELSKLIDVLETEMYNPDDLNDRINEFKEKWNSIGPVPKDSENTIQEKYNKLNSRLSSLFQGLLEKEAFENTRNIKQKEDILAKIEKLANEGGFEQNKDKFEAICNEWNELSLELPDQTEEKLNERFDTHCNAFQCKDKEYFTTSRSDKEKNLKNKIKVCVELEKLADVSVTDGFFSENSTENLADELMFAIKGNFGLEENSGKSEVSKEQKYTKYKKLKKEWESIGAVPIEEYENINIRYNKICSIIESKFA